MLQTHLPSSLADLTGLAAGIGIVLLANSPDGLLGMPWLTEPGAPAVCRRGTRRRPAGPSTVRWPVPPELPTQATCAALAVEDVSVHFGGVAALSDVSLRAEAGRSPG